MPLRRDVVVLCLLLGAGLLQPQTVPALAEGKPRDRAVCPDMSQHESVLNEGTHYLEQHGGSGYGGGAGEDLVGAFNYPGQQTAIDATPPPFYGREPDIDRILLNSASDFESARWQARAYERAGRLDSAERLYRRVEAAMKATEKPDSEIVRDAEQGIARISLFRSSCEAGMENGASAQLSDMFFWMLGRSHLSSRRYEEIRQVLEQRYVDRLSKCTNEQLVRALDLYGDTLRVLGGQEALDLQTKQWYANAVVDALSYRQFQTLPECSPILTKAQRMNDDCRRSIACLSMAVQLDETASKLESQGSYSMAEKLYRQCLEIKEKNLGKTAPETLAVYGDLARLCADQKQYPQAESLYDQALNGFRKLPVPGVEYGRVLESYADMLAQLKQTSKADKLYAEARAHYATAGSVH